MNATLKSEVQTLKDQLQQMSNMEVALKDDNEKLRRKLNAATERSSAEIRSLIERQTADHIKMGSRIDEAMSEVNMWRLLAIAGWIGFGAVALIVIF